ncbi:MAG: response regulator [Desulfobulbaceae bacterium]|nr:response regulator [Desulfobulbaceae bacterium]HIJ89942.1 response regulator [Deltaproteobacteria bacterium]
MPTILIATDNAADAEFVMRQLAEEYENVFTSINHETSVKEFDSKLPDVLVLAFNSLEKAERYYLGLYRLSTLVHTHPHRTVILCDKDELNRVHDLCMKDYFDDYILFWPMAHDIKRLSMAIHHAVRGLASNKAAFSAVEFAALARRLPDLEPLLKWHVVEGNERIDTASDSIARAQQEMNAALDDFFQRLTQGDFSNLVEVKDAKGLQYEIGRLQQEMIPDRFHGAIESIMAIKSSAQEFQQKYAPHLESVHALRAMAKKAPATIMVVDDDELARKLFKTMFEPENYELMFAASGIEALALLNNRRPDLILMDMMMPDIDGLELTRRIKSTEQFSNIPIIMVTCNSSQSIVKQCLMAGASNYVVKPFNRTNLLKKIDKFLWHR